MKNEVIPVIEEEAIVQKRVVESGEVGVRRASEEIEQVVEIPLARSEATVERRPVRYEVESAPPARMEGDEWVLPVCREEVVVEKRLFVVEEVRVRKEHHTEIQRETVSLRKDTVVVERK